MMINSRSTFSEGIAYFNAWVPPRPKSKFPKKKIGSGIIYRSSGEFEGKVQSIGLLCRMYLLIDVENEPSSNIEHCRERELWLLTKTKFRSMKWKWTVGFVDFKGQSRLVSRSMRRFMLVQKETIHTPDIPVQLREVEKKEIWLIRWTTLSISSLHRWQTINALNLPVRCQDNLIHDGD